jgi:hypothetical protein
MVPNLQQQQDKSYTWAWVLENDAWVLQRFKSICAIVDLSLLYTATVVSAISLDLVVVYLERSPSIVK